MRRILMTMTAAAMFVMSFAGPGAAQKPHLKGTFPGDTIKITLPADTQDRLVELLDSRSLPEVSSVVLSPENPKADEPVTVTAHFNIAPRTRGDAVDQAAIIYSTDAGKSWSQASMEQDKEILKAWSGTIPGQPAGTDVLFGLKAINYSGHAYIEAVCMVAGKPQDDENYVKNDCAHRKDAKCEESGLPRGCMFPMSVSSPDPEDYDAAAPIPPDLDLKDVRVGHDEKNLYLDISVAGKVSPGTLSPMSMHIYVAGGINPDRRQFGAGLDSVVTQGAAIIFIPVDITSPCAIYYMGQTEVMQDTFNGDCAARENHLFLSAARKITEPNPSNTLEFIVMDFMQTSIFPNVMPLYDFSMFTRVKFETRGYKVK